MNKCQLLNLTIQRLCNNGGGGVPADPDAVLVLPLNGNVTDLSNNGYVATVHGSPGYVTGYFGGTQAIDITDGNYIEYSVPANNGTFSADFFVYTARARDVRTGCYSVLTSNIVDYGGITVTSSSATYPNGTRIITFTLPYNQWIHIAITRDNSNVIRFFKNGTLVGSYSGSDYNVWNAGTRVAIDSGAVYNQDRHMHVSNYKLSTAVLHVESNGVFSYPVPTGLYY